MENLRESNADSNGTFLKNIVGGAGTGKSASAMTKTAATTTTTTKNGAESALTAAAGLYKAQDSEAQLNWLQHLHSNSNSKSGGSGGSGNNNNNNNNSTHVNTTVQEKPNTIETARVVSAASGDGDGCSGSIQNSWRCVSCESAAAVALGEGAAAALQHKHSTTATNQQQPSAAAGALALVHMDERGVSASNSTNGQKVEQQTPTECRNGASSPSNSLLQTTAAAAAIAIPKEAVAAHDSANLYESSATIGAASLSPPGASGHTHSNRSASPNNSTENLSYSSDNYYPDNLILLEDDDDDVVDEVDDDDVVAEEISLNSDDCVYAYRGDGADFDLSLNTITGRNAGNEGLVDDEMMDFLEMDFEPDPLSEIEYGSVETGHAHPDAFLLQRDSCHLSGRHSASLSLHACTPTQRQLFSSPIDDDLPPPPKGLQSQLMLSKNFARITMHLDQIKGENGDCDIFERTHSDRASVLGMLSDDTAVETPVTTTTAHSLPNTLLTSFGRDMRHGKEEVKTSPSKVTGAKPKRLSTFSTSSSTSSKNSSKSRQSLRSSYAASALCNSSSFDERSVSCTEFRCVAASNGADECLPPPPTTVVSSASNCDDLSTNDETCLDCLEKEFLANTIGKAIDLNECPKCRKRSSGIALYKRVVQQQAATHCHSGSPAFFGETRDDCLFEAAANDFLGVRQTDEWTTPIKDRALDEGGGSGGGGCGSSCVGADNGAKAKGKLRARARSRTCDVADVLQLRASNADEVINQRRTTCDNLNSEHLLKNLLLTEKEIVTISTLNLNEETLVQALDKLNISYNLELIKSHFKARYTSNNSSSKTFSATPGTSSCKNYKEYKDLKQFLLHESKKNCNYPKLKRLIEVATRQQLEVQYKKDNNILSQEVVSVKVADILHQWIRNKKLDVLKQLDKRFIDANVLGKIANIIRQAQQRCTPRRPLPENISIPQYYASGYLTLTKKC